MQDDTHSPTQANTQSHVHRHEQTPICMPRYHPLTHTRQPSTHPHKITPTHTNIHTLTFAPAQVNMNMDVPAAVATTRIIHTYGPRHKFTNHERCGRVAQYHHHVTIHIHHTILRRSTRGLPHPPDVHASHASPPNRLGSKGCIQGEGLPLDILHVADADIAEGVSEP